MSNFVAVLLATLVYLPGTTMGSMIRIGVVVCAYVLVPATTEYGNEREISSIAKCIFVSPFIPIIFVMMSGGINTGIMVHETMRMAFCAILLLTVSKMHVSFEAIYLATLVAFIPNFTIQVMEYLHIPGVINFIIQHYVTDPNTNLVHLELATYSGMDFRSGSIFINPNVYMIIPMLSMCVFFYKDRHRPSLINTVLIIATVVSGLLTGSRTSIIVMATIMAVYYFKYSTGFSKIIAIAVLAFVILKFGPNLISNSRALQVMDTDSADAKYMSFIWYWQKTSSVPWLWVTGSLGSYLTTGMDSEWGYIYAWYGLFGLSWYIRYLKAMWFNNYQIEFYSKLITICCAMTAMTATVLLCMPIYSFACLIAFSHLQESTYNLEEW